MTLLDHQFLWGYVESIVYVDETATIDQILTGFYKT